MVMKILLVDDDAFLRDMYATKFTESGHAVETAEHAAAGLRKLHDDPTYDVILLDMVMPGMTGVELIEKATQEFPDLKFLFIVLSNQGQKSDIESAMRAGAIGYIVKAESIPSEVVKRVSDLYEEHHT